MKTDLVSDDNETSSLVRIVCASSSKPRPFMKPLDPSEGTKRLRTYRVASSN